MDVVAEVNEELIAEVLAIATGIPVFKLTEEESQRLLRMEDELHRRVIGQNDAIKALSQAIRRTRAGLKDPKRPGCSGPRPAMSATRKAASSQRRCAGVRSRSCCSTRSRRRTRTSSTRCCR